MTSLLDGVRVLDVTTVLAGPFAGYQLGLLGADVVKVEVPGSGDLSRDVGADRELRGAQMGASFVAQNAGKRSVTVNLKTDGGREVFTRMLSRSDVLLENMRPGVLARLGFPWERLKAINGGLIYCALSGFGQTGPLAGRPAYDQIIQGLSGMCDVTGLPDGPPLRVGFPICDTMGGLAAALAICAALVRRSQDGVGRILDVSMLETALTAMGWVVSDHLVAGQPATRHGNDNATSSPSGTFRTADGALNIATNTQAQFEALCAVAECAHLVDDLRFATREDRKRNRAALRDELETALKRRTAREWEDLLTRVSVPAGRVLSVHDALTHEQIAARELLHEIAVPGAQKDTVAVLGNGIHVDGSALAPGSPPPRLGEHTDPVLRSLGYTDADIAAFREAGAV